VFIFALVLTLKQSRYKYCKVLLHPFNGLFSRTTRVSQHRKGKTILDINGARDDGVAVASAGASANHLQVLCKVITKTIILWPFVRDYPGEPVPEETFTHPPS